MSMSKHVSTAIVVLSLVCVPGVASGDDWKDESGKGRGNPKEFWKQQEKFLEQQRKQQEKQWKRVEKLREEERRAWEKQREYEEKRREKHREEHEKWREHVDESRDRQMHPLPPAGFRYEQYAVPPRWGLPYYGGIPLDAAPAPDGPYRSWSHDGYYEPYPHPGRLHPPLIYPQMPFRYDH